MFLIKKKEKHFLKLIEFQMFREEILPLSMNNLKNNCFIEGL